MARNTSVSLGEHFSGFIEEKVREGRYGSASEVIRAGLRLLEEEEAKLARLRELIAEGRSQEEVKDFFVERYGEVVLMTPSTSGANLLLWAAGPLMLLAALGIGGSYLRGRANATPQSETALSEAEQARLDALLKE